MKIFTTGQVAKLCSVAPRTVSKWFDTGRLRGYRIPGSENRRIPKAYLVKFLKEHGMPIPQELEDSPLVKVLIISSNELWATGLQQAMPEHQWLSRTASSTFSAGVLAQSSLPNALVLDFCSIEVAQLRKLCLELRAQPGFENTVLVAVLPPEIDLDRNLVDESFSRSAPTQVIASRIRQLVIKAKELV